MVTDRIIYRTEGGNLSRGVHNIFHFIDNLSLLTWIQGQILSRDIAFTILWFGEVFNTRPQPQA